MHLNIDCIHDILLCIEESTGYRKPAVFLDTTYPRQIIEHLGDERLKVPSYQLDLESKYSDDMLMYHIKYCVNARLLESGSAISEYQLIIQDLTPQGHEFLSNIRSQTILEKAKALAINLGIDDIHSINSLAAGLVKQFIINALMS